MKISVFGLGYTGAVSAGCLADGGHTVIGVDTDISKVTAIQAGRCPVREKDLSEIIAGAVRKGLLHATAHHEEAVRATDMSLLCVGTPGRENGKPDLRFISSACESIGGVLAEKETFHAVLVRSTIPPGTTKEVIIPLLEKASGKQHDTHFGVCHNPEFLREGSAVFDFLHPGRIIIGTDNARAGDMAEALYKTLPAKVFHCAPEISEMLKYTENAWHAAKVAFANEIGNICHALHIDSHRVMDIFCEDTRLNLSPYYMKPGFAFGGSCLPKDVRGLRHAAQERQVTTPLLDALLVSNTLQVRRGLEMIVSTGKKNIGLLGVSFKAGTDDVRESPLVSIAEQLLDKEYTLAIYDRNVTADHAAKLAPYLRNDLQQVLEESDTIVIGNNAREFSGITGKLRPDQVVIDFVRMKEVEENHPHYHGICW